MASGSAAGDVAFVGLGNMGSAMVRNLSENGVRVHTWSRTDTRYAPLDDLDLHRKGSLAELAGSAQIICLNVTTTHDVASLLFNEDGIAAHAARGAVVADFSTIDATSAQRFAERLAGEFGIGFVDCPVSGGVAGAQAATLSIMAGGTAEDYARVESVLRLLGSTVRHVGPPGAGQAIKAANQMAMCIQLVGIAEAFALAREQGADLAVTLEMLQAGLAGSRVLDWAGPHIVEGFERAATIESRLHEKDIAMISEAAVARNLNLPLLRKTAEVLGELVARGQGYEDTSRVFEVVAGHLHDA